VFLRVSATLAVALALSTPAFATDYYISAAGNDGNGGTTSQTPWRTFARVNALTMRAGDRILLRGGDTIDGGLFFDASDVGTAALPIEVTSYGTGRSTIRTAGGPGISAIDTAGFRISNVNVLSAGSLDSGIVFYTASPGNVKRPYIRIESVDVNGFGRDGVEIGSWNGATGFRDVRLTGVVARGNARTGIIFYAQVPNVHESVYVGYSRAYDNPGIPSATSNTGNGIVFGGVNGGEIERSLAWGNGRLSQSSGGPVGIWAYDSTRIVIQHNESFDNRTGGRSDGGGFDLDQNVSYSLMQYNYAHGNDGSGYLLAHSLGGDAHRGNIIRYNVSENDGRKNGYGAIEVWGRVLDTEIHNNTVFLSPALTGAPVAVRVHNVSIESHDTARLRVRNNILQASGGLPLVEVAASQLDGSIGLRFESNAYHGTSGFHVRWGASVYTDLTAWRTTGQETRSGVPLGISVDPLLVAPGAGGTIADPSRLETMSAYRLQQGSPAADAALDLDAVDGIDMGGRDFSGAVAPQGAGYAMGAFEPAPSSVAPEIVLHVANGAAVSGWTRIVDSSAASGARLVSPNAGAAKLVAPLALPSQYFDVTFNAVANQPYRLWIRSRAEADYWGNDSVFVQFSSSKNASGSQAWRIGTTDGLAVNLEDCSGCGIAGWGWQDDGWGVGVLGPLVYFETDGLQTLRVQTREDGLSIDQIVLSPANYLTRGPGALKNDSTILPATGSPTPAPPLPSTTEINLYAADVPASALVGEWRLVSDATAFRGVSLWQPNRGAAKVVTALASPASFVDLTFTAEAGRPYHLWVHLRAEGNAWANDSVHLQFSGTVASSGAPTFRIGTTTSAEVNLEDCSGCGLAGWGWQDNAWGSLASPIYFERTGTQTVRIQPREDGVIIDRIVISATALTAAPR
jgi:hypothetical protein